MRVFNELFNKHTRILDCAAGTGTYAFYLTEQGYDVTATDITPRHIDVIRNTLVDKNYKMDTAVLDATDMNIFEEEVFDVVLNIGPFYHLITEEQREKCLLESLRVLKKGGLIVIAYIPRHYVFQLVAMTNQSIWMRHWHRRLYRPGY